MLVLNLGIKLLEVSSPKKTLWWPFKTLLSIVDIYFTYYFAHACDAYIFTAVCVAEESKVEPHIC